MNPKRILFLGTTGVGKREAVTRLAQWCKDRSMPEWTIIDFEKDFLYRAVGRVEFPNVNFEDLTIEEIRRHFLDAQQHKQLKYWMAAWQDFNSQLLNENEEGLASRNIFLCAHACYTRSHFGVRSVLSAYSVANDFKPDLIFTLIDDVYNAWWTTRRRALEQKSVNESYVGRPKFEDLIYARRAELLVGDHISHACAAGNRAVKNLMMSVSHPIETFLHCINHPTKFRVAYLSFPISMPREAEAEGENGPMQEISAFIREAYALQNRVPNLVIQCPLGIDEIPLVNALKKSDNEAETFEFNRDNLRWSLDDLWDAEDRLGITPDMGDPISIEEMRNAAGSISADVGFRDYRLVDQADFLLVFNPIYRLNTVAALRERDTVAKSVDKEVQHAKSHEKRVYIFQDRAHDALNVVDRIYGPVLSPTDRATMGDNPWDNLTTRIADRKQLLDVLKIGRRA